MKKIIAFSKYIFYAVGGAEKSMHSILRKKSAEGYSVTLIGVREINSFNSQEYRLEIPKEWEAIEIKFPFQLKRFFYFEYFLNRNSIKKFLSERIGDSEMYTYGFYAPIIALHYSGYSTIYLRSESDLGFNENYYHGFKWLVKSILKIIEYPFYQIYCRDLKRAYQKSTLIFNSKWMQEECIKRFKVDGQIEYPSIDFEELQSQYAQGGTISEKGIVFIGDSEVKGLSLVQKIAKKLPNIQFYIFSRKHNSRTDVHNIAYMPWSTNSSLPYLHAKLVIVPSIWYEAYGRVSAEARYLGVPVLVSRRGGLPESVVNDTRFIVDDYKNSNEWVKRINEILALKN